MAPVRSPYRCPALTTSLHLISCFLGPTPVWVLRDGVSGGSHTWGDEVRTVTKTSTKGPAGVHGHLVLLIQRQYGAALEEEPERGWLGEGACVSAFPPLLLVWRPLKALLPSHDVPWTREERSPTQDGKEWVLGRTRGDVSWSWEKVRCPCQDETAQVGDGGVAASTQR